MIELMQNLAELGVMLDRMAQPLPTEIEEVFVVERESYEPVEGITYV